MTIEPLRQGPLDRGRVARPLRRDRPRGLRARAAAQRPVRVHQHRRQEDVDLEGPRRGGPRDRRRDPARAAPLLLPPPQAEPRGRLRPDRDRRGAAASSTSSTDSRRRRRARRSGARSPPGFENTFRYSLLDANADVAAEAAQVPARVRPPRAAAPDPERRRRGADGGGEGERAGRARGVRSSTSASKPPAPGSPRTRPTRRASRSVATRCPPSARGARRRAARATSPPWPTASTPSDRPPATRGRTAIFDAATQAGLDAKTAFAAIYLAFLGRTNGPRAGWLLASLDVGFVLERLREASAAPVGGAA